MKLRNKQVLVTGADGFIGSHLVERLVREGARVRALVCYNALDSRGWLDDCSAAVRDSVGVLPGDVRDAERVHEAVAGCELVFHLAALIAIPYSYSAPRSYVETNISGTLNVLEAVRRCGVERLIHTSTSEVYGSACYVPIDEAHPLVAQSPYAATKIAADQLALSYQRTFDTPVCVIRPFNTYGPRQSVRAVIPTIILQLLSEDPLVRLGNLSPTRDFSFVADTVDGFIAMACAQGVLGQVVNIGSGLEVSIEHVAQLIAEIAGRPLELVCDHQRRRPETGEVERLCADNSRACELLGWTPEHCGEAGLREGLQKTIDWFWNPVNRTRFRERIHAV